MPLLRATDHARALLRRAQLALAVLAVLIAVPVGVLAGASRADAPAPHHDTARAELLEPALPAEAAVAGDLVPVEAHWLGPRGELHWGTLRAPAGLPAGASVTVALDDSGAIVPPPPPVAGPTATGLAAGLGTLAICWSVLALAGAIWRARLAARDNRALTREWARVEPVWSRRRV
ncbi:Rv1733c family protein [Pseudonocardia humida]|uniref:Transmembrane protein n=1 Tax=Pseudonocardia humida TaxID=2800819 RepID=A0ABT1A276_9PSEU|nr:hypothetical protein [Pseudonocardia humida]MCO1656914.1 hypothetical protein [Pseudonocardia humida]